MKYKIDTIYVAFQKLMRSFFINIIMFKNVSFIVSRWKLNYFSSLLGENMSTQYQQNHYSDKKN